MIKWHDLRKDPADLPNDSRYVWTNVGAGYHDYDGWWDDFGRLYDVISWCEPKFEDIPREASITELRAKDIIKNLINDLLTVDGEQTMELSSVKEAERFLKEV